MARGKKKEEPSGKQPTNEPSPAQTKPRAPDKWVLIASENPAVRFVLAHFVATFFGLKPFRTRTPDEAREAAASGFFRVLFYTDDETGYEAVKAGWMHAHLVSADVSKVAERYMFDMEGGLQALPWVDICSKCRALRDGTLEEHAPPFRVALSPEGVASGSQATPVLRSDETSTLASETHELESERKQPECDVPRGPTVVHEPDRTVTIELRADRTVIVNGRKLPKLRRAEMQLLRILHYRRPGVVHWSTLYRLLWPTKPPADPRHAVDVLLERLRRKFIPDDDLIETVKGVGVRLLALPSAP